MKLAYFPEQMALQSEPVWRAFLEGCKKHSITIVENDINADAVVIWSVLWHGRLRANLGIYNHYRSQNKPVFIIEVGSLRRGKTWKISVNNITTGGIYPQISDLNVNRPKELGISLSPYRETRRNAILIATQHQHSLQWDNQPSVDTWVLEQIRQVRKYTDMPIVIRPHPRCRIQDVNGKHITMDQPFKIPGSYDMYNIDFDYHCVINYCSGPSVQAAISGTPIICNEKSLAYPVSMPFEQIITPFLPSREEWFIKLCHTEWTVDEISQGIPQKYLLNQLTL